VKDNTPIELLKTELVILIVKYAQEDLIDFSLWPIEQTVKRAKIEVKDSSKEVIRIIQELETEQSLVGFIRRMIELFDDYPDRQEELADLIFSYEFRIEWI
jgi:hypothetical protein